MRPGGSNPQCAFLPAALVHSRLTSSGARYGFRGLRRAANDAGLKPKGFGHDAGQFRSQTPPVCAVASKRPASCFNLLQPLAQFFDNESAPWTSRSFWKVRHHLLALAAGTLRAGRPWHRNKVSAKSPASDGDIAPLFPEISGSRIGQFRDAARI